MRMLCRGLLIIFCVLFVVGTSHASARIYDEKSGTIYVGGYPLKIRSDRFNKRIIAVNVRDNSSKLIIETADPIYWYEVSTKGYIAVSVSSRVEGKAKKALILYSAEGRELEKIDDVPATLVNKYFSWSPDGTKVAYVKGELVEGKRYPFYPLGTYVYDVVRKEETKIFDGGRSVNWSEHDGNIYILLSTDDTQRIAMFDASSKKIFPKTDKMGLIFSDDGKYYVGNTYEYESVEVGGVFESRIVDRYLIYNNSTNTPYYQFKIGKNEGQEEWIGTAIFITGSHNLLMRGPEGGFKIFNGDDMHTIRGGPLNVLGWNDGRTKIIVYDRDDAKIMHIEDALTGRRLHSFNVP